MSRFCGLCNFYKVDGYRDSSGGTHDCCRFNQASCHLKGCQFLCKPKVITQWAEACENYRHDLLDWDKVLGK